VQGRQIALAWTLHQPAVAPTLIGATRTEQLHANLDAAALTVPADVLHALDSASHQRAGSPYRLFPAAASCAPGRPNPDSAPATGGAESLGRRTIVERHSR